MTDIYIAKLEIPPKAVGDAVHNAIASIHEVDYLVTLNCSHIANGGIIKKLAEEVHYDVHKLIENMRKREKESKATAVSREGKKTTIK